MCHHRHRRYERDIERFAAPAPPSGPMRVGDAERERVVELLRAHAAAGRLEADELEERLERAYQARYGSDLDAVLAELPAEQPAPRARPSQPRLVAAPLLPLAIGALIALAALTSAWWLLWLIWPIVIALGPRRHYRRARL
jgi:Domain of unknown function (DUF1707)